MNQIIKMFNRGNGRRFFGRQGRKGIATWTLILISGIGTLGAFLFNQKGNANKKSATDLGNTVHRPRTKSTHGMNYAWAAEMAEDFLKNTDKKKIL